MKRTQTALWMVLVIVAAGFAPFNLHAQNPVAVMDSGAPLNRVKTTVTVKARPARSSTEVNAPDVMVYENGQRRPVLDWRLAQAGDASVDLAILMDDSLASNIGLQMGDLRHFILSQPANTRVEIAYGTHGDATVLQGFTTDHQLAAEAIRLPVGRQNEISSIYQSLADLVKHWPESGNRRAALVVSDGIDLFYGVTDSQPPLNLDLQKAIGSAQRAGVTVYTIFANTAGGYGHNLFLNANGQGCLESLASETGGEAYFQSLETPLALAPYLQQMVTSLGQQYLLTFEAQPGASGFRTLRVTTEQPGVKLLAPAQVYVPAGGKS